MSAHIPRRLAVEHTAGSIRYDYEPGYCGELIARDGMTVAAFDNEPSEADARRLVACWNACDGVSTEHLEDDAVRKLIQDRDLLLAQRYELLEFARSVVRYAGSAMDDYLADKAREIITKAIG